MASECDDHSGLLEPAALREHDEHLSFEHLLTGLSARFIDAGGEAIDAAIRDVLQQVAEAFALDRSTLYQFAGDPPIGWAGADVAPITGPWRERFPWTCERVLANEAVAFASPSELPGEIDRATHRALDTTSALVVPLTVNGAIAGVVEFDRVRTDRPWSPEQVRRLRLVAGLLAHVLARQQHDAAVRAAIAEAERVRHHLPAEDSSQRAGRSWIGAPHIVGASPQVRRVIEQIEQVAPTDSTVLLLGETGTGKELFAAQIHELSLRHQRPMVRVNCAAMPSSLIESELFGREKGAYTGALTRQAGRFELADRSTIFLDEIGDLPPDVQVKLLRAIEERQIERLGSPRPIIVDARIIAATHQNLEQRIAEGAFREDLFYRLNVFPIRVPPLRDRVEDIPLIVWRFVEEFAKAFGKRIETISRESLADLQQYSWPGNVRELRNVVERAMIVAGGPRLTIPAPQVSRVAAKRSSKLVDVEKEHIRSVLEGAGWRIRGSGGAADRLGLKPTTLETRMAKLGLKRPGH